MDYPKIINKLKKKMYDRENTRPEEAQFINNLILDLDYERALCEDDKLRAGKEWHYRMRKYHDWYCGVI